MAISLSREALLSRLKALLAVQRFNHTAAKAGNDLELEQVEFDGYKLNAKEMGITRGKISPSSCSVLQELKNAGFEAYLVGGCVRDLILNKVPKDFEVITTATLEEVKSLFKCSLIIRKEFSICRVPIQGSVLEVSHFQTGKVKGNKQNFPQMPQGLDKEDALLWSEAMRRDFTVNSLFYDPFANKIYDYAGGVKDLRSLELRTLIPAHISFTEDCARILRGLRIAARIGLSISGQTETAIHKFSSSIASLPKSRLMMEMNYMLSYGAAEASLCLLCRFHLLKTLLPLHAAHLAQQINGKSDMNSLYLMRLFSNLDKLVTCDRPSDSILWIAILAFHLTLLNEPQAPIVIWTFGSLLYNNNLPAAVAFAREMAEVPIISVAEISDGFISISDVVLIKTVNELAASVQSSVCAKYDDLIYIPHKTMIHTARLFRFQAVKASILKKSTESVLIDHHLLGEGDLSVTRCALGKIILDTMAEFLCESDGYSVYKNALKKAIQLENVKGSNVGALLNEKNKQTGSIQSTKKNHRHVKLKYACISNIGVLLHTEKVERVHGIQRVRKNHFLKKLENRSGSKVEVVLHTEKIEQVHGIQNRSAKKKNHHPIKSENASGSKVGVVLYNEKIKQVDGIESAKKQNQLSIQLENMSGSEVGLVLHKDKNKKTNGIQSATEKNEPPIDLENTFGAKVLLILANARKTGSIQNQESLKLDKESGSNIGVVLHNEKNNQVEGIHMIKEKNQKPIKLEQTLGSKDGVPHCEKNMQANDGTKSVKKNEEHVNVSKVGKTDPIIHMVRKAIDQMKSKLFKTKK